MDDVVKRFGAAARKFCGLIESCDGEDWQSFQFQFMQALAGLLTEAYALPNVGSPDAYSVATRASHDEADALRQRLTRTLPVKNFWSIVPGLQDPEPFQVDAVSNLCDIWMELQTGLREQRGAKAAIWEWRFGFLGRWGSKATTVLDCLHRTMQIRPK